MGKYVEYDNKKSNEVIFGSRTPTNHFARDCQHVCTQRSYISLGVLRGQQLSGRPNHKFTHHLRTRKSPKNHRHPANPHKKRHQQVHSRRDDLTPRQLFRGTHPPTRRPQPPSSNSGPSGRDPKISKIRGQRRAEKATSTTPRTAARTESRFPAGPSRIAPNGRARTRGHVVADASGGEVGESSIFRNLWR